MTTPAIRTALIAQITPLVAPMQVFDLTEYTSIDDIPLNSTTECLLVDFISASERVTTIGGSGNQGWEEDGTLALHWLLPTGFPTAPVLAKCETLRLALRGQRIGRVILESVEPFMQTGSPIGIDGGWTGLSSLMYYTNNTCG
jgi:hypothetical protein